MQTETIFDPRTSTGETTYFYFLVNTLLVSNFLVRKPPSQIAYHTKVKLLNPFVRGEVVKIHKNMTYNDSTRALETSILIVKFSNDVSFSVIIQTQNI